jgi:hypothetical protein
MRPVFAALAFMLSLSVPSVGMAQQGHPLVGIWLGSWGAGDTHNDVVLELNWMNTTLSGNINPGFPDEAIIEAGALDPANWTVHLEATSKDESGNPVKVVVDGKLDNLGSAKRTLSGTWKRGDVSGPFNLTRE